jgi:hypothetical protein
MFAERLESTLKNADLASPSRLARLAHTDLGNSDTVSRVFATITSQCQRRRSIDPLFRFIEASLAVKSPTIAISIKTFVSVLMQFV